MRLMRIEVEGVGRFASRAVVEGLGPGVNVLADDNEAGKSTIFRAVRICLFSRHTSRDKGVRALATEGRELPVRIAVTFEADGASWEIAKTFLRTPKSLLTRNGERFAEGDAADEKVWQLLGLEPGSGRASLDEAAYGLLWVEQGKSCEALEVTEGAAGALSDAIQQEVGTLVGGDRARRALAELDEALATELTARDQPRAGGALAAAQSALREAESGYAEASVKLAALNDSLDRLAKLKADLARASDPALLRSQDDAARAAADVLERMQAAESEVRAAETAEAQARELLDAARTALGEAQARARRIDEAEERLAVLSHQIETGQSDETGLRTALARLQQGTEETGQQLARLDEREKQLRRLVQAVDADRRRDGLAQRIEALRTAGEALDRHLAALRANTVTEAVLGDLDAILRDQDTLEAQIAATATVAAIAVTAGTRVTAGGEVISGHRTLTITEATVIEAPGVVVSLTPPARHETAARERRQALRKKLEDLLGQHGAATAAALREKGAARRALDQDAARARATLSGFGVDERTLTDALKRERAELASIEASVQQALAECGAAALPSLAEIEAQRRTAEAERVKVREEQATANGRVEVAGRSLTELAARLGEWRGKSKEIAARLDADLATLPHAARAGELQRRADDTAAKARAHEAAAATLDAVRRSAPDAAAIERAEIDAKRLAVARDNHRKQLGDLRDLVANLEGQIDAQGGDGLGERVAELAERHALAQADHARISHRVETLKLLRDTIAAAYAERREQLNAPLRRHLAPFLGDVFPAAEVGIGEGFQVAGLTRQGNEAFDRLSGGTREQIAVLVRLAMAALLAERGREAPVILDDALVYCDDERIEQMFTALNRAGRNQQVIVFTCRSRAFQTLGGRPLRLVPG